MSRKTSSVPNAPSTTGKPSGSGRGNAPTRPNRTPPPPPKKSN